MAEELVISSHTVFDGLKRIEKVKNSIAPRFERSIEIVTFRGLFLFAFMQ